MGNKLSCSCAPLMRKAYRYEDSPWQSSRRRDGHLLSSFRLWAEVFHVSASGAGTVKWQQVSEDLVPVNITCIQDSPECIFHITAYNSQVDKILDVRLVQPGTRIGQASECFVYWKDPMTNDTWGLNFTSPIDAKQFRECCVSYIVKKYSPSFKFSRKASSSYSLKLDPPGKGKVKAKRKPLSTPASPSRVRQEPQCTCMSAEQYARLRTDPRVRGSSTLPRNVGSHRITDVDGQQQGKVVSAVSSTSLYDNVASGGPSQAGDTLQRQLKGQDGAMVANAGVNTNTPGVIVTGVGSGSDMCTQNHVGSQVGQDDGGACQMDMDLSKSEGTQVGGGLHQSVGTSTKSTGTRSKDFNEDMTRDAHSHDMHHQHNVINNNTRRKTKSTEDMNVDTSTLKRMLKPMPSTESPVTSPEMGRRRYNYYNANAAQTLGPQHMHQHAMNMAMGGGGGGGGGHHVMNNNTLGRGSGGGGGSQSSRFSGSRSSHEIGRGYPPRNLYLELERERERSCIEGSPPSDNVMFDNQCYATTPSSSNGNSDQDQSYGQQQPQQQSSQQQQQQQQQHQPHPQQRSSRHQHHQHQQAPNVTPTPGSPTSRLLMEYEMHLRNTLAKGMDAESYSLHTFEALLSQSMENLANAKSSTLPLPPHRPLSTIRDKERDRDRDGYYSDRNELIRERERERDRGYLSDHNASFSNSRCASCIGESARAQWFRHSDGWRSGSSTIGSGSGHGMMTQQVPGSGHKRSPWDSLPSLRQDSSLNDSGYKSARADSLEQRAEFIRQDSLRSEYLSDRESRYGIVQQASIESTDSRMCYLTSSEISDDDRMSLTTAVSDEDDGESVMASPYKAKATGTAASSFNCTGAVRKAGFLSVKKWLLRKKHQIELARKRGWKGYWVCLKGTTLLFYPCDSREGRSVEAAPKHLIIVDGAIMQPIPEHPKRDYIFCLSTAFGDAYLFQAPCQVELENWVNSIHSACAAAFARHRGKTGTLHLLQEEIFRLEKAIESDHKLKHMAELQQSVVTDQETRHQIQTQILQWEENLERLHCEQFRLRCYMASLQSGELPNPKSLLTHVSRPTKNTLNKLGVFTVSSFHAFICARSPSLLNNLLAGRGATKRRPPMLSRSNSGSSRRSMQMNSRDEPEKTFKVAMPDNAYSTVYLRDAMSVEEFLASACARRSLNPMEHFVRVKKRRDMEDHNYFVPHRNDLIENYLHNHEFVEVCMKILYQVELQRTTLEQMWGFSVEAELIENAERQDELCCYVSRVEDKSVAMHNGIIKGDEIMVINGAIVSDLDMMYLESVLQEEQSLSMMMRSSRTEPPDLVGIMRVTDDMIDSLVCPPPPTDPPVMSEEMITGLIVPAPGWNGTGKDLYSPEAESSPAPSFVEPTVSQLAVGAGGVSGLGVAKPTSRTSSFEIENLLKTAEQVTGFCRSPQETRKSSPTGSVTSSVSTTALTPSRQLTDAEKLRKVIMELVDTERTYVKHLNNLLEHYLEPMKRETFLSNAEINALFGNIHEIVTFQRQFLQNLEEALELEPEFNKFEHCGQFRNVLFAIGSAFLYYVNHFKLYSSFCASHSKAQKVLHPNEGNHALQEFLAARNPKQQHSSTLESYLIKPIQRILKYPLLLQQMRNLTDTRADEHVHLCEALKGMEKVAEHINEMQRIHEEYGAIFDHLFRQHQKSCKQPIDLSPGDLLYYGGVEWLNISDFLGKIKKGLELHAMCFVFKSAVVFLCKERLRQKKKLMGVSSKNAPNEVEIIRYQVLIPVTEVQVRASSAKDMDSHFLWELIHLRSQLQRRSEKVYVLSNSTADFRNAFLKTIRQIIRESVRNMSIPMKNFGGSSGSVSGLSSQLGGYAGNSQTLERPKQQITIVHGSHTLGKPKKKSGSQRHSAGNIDYDNLSGSQEGDDLPPTVGVVHYAPHTQQQQQQPGGNGGGFRGRSKTLGDVTDIIQSPVDSQQPPHQMQQQQQQQQAAAPHQHPHPHPHPREPPPPPIRQPHLHHHSTDIERIDPGTKSEGEEDSQQGTIRPKATLGRTPNHLTLSTTSTLSVGSTGSQARLIQSSHPPASYQPVLMKDLGKSSESEIESESEAHAAQVAATFNLSLGSSGSLFATTTTITTVSSDPDPYPLSLTQTQTQSLSQTLRHLSPRQSPRQSPKQEIEVIEIFESEAERNAASQQVAVVHQHPSGSRDSQHKRRERERDSSSSSGCSEHVAESDATSRYMDKHLSDLEQENLAAGTCDIAAYMASLREKSFDAADIAEEAADQQQNDSSLSPEPQTIVENTQQTVTVDIESPSRPATESDSTGNTTGPSERSGDETEDEPTSSLASHIVVIDKKVDKVFKAKSPERGTAAAATATGTVKSKTSKRQSIYISPDRCKSQGSSPVRIIKIKSPRSSVSEQGKRLSICSSRDNSQDRLSAGRRTPSPRRSSEGGGGILKHTNTGGGILKPPASPAKSKSPDRSCLKKGGPSHVCSAEPTTAATSLSPRISPRSSVDHLSPDRASICQRHSPRSSFDSRDGGSDHNLDVPYGGSRKRSMSAHGSFETGHKPHAQETYQYYPVYDNQTCSDHYVAAAPTTNRYGGSGNGRSRLSKSLERSTSRDSTTSSSYRAYGVSPERSYVVYSSGPLRSQSAENTFSQPIYDALPRQAPQQYMPMTMPMVSYMQEMDMDMEMGYGPPPSCPHEPTGQSSYQLSSSAPEYTTCIDCLYQKRPS
ncbi:protein still life, isoform SIF type 1 isoform X3 [Drosophila albomicans]|uniref:Protein still life, isoform SIF type 1 isoform X3 n=1 Tax=Drosophila albomicans TaxID=7291 RepID=A0A6P8Y9T4_DROAB|nr:protein still life, isoform SIF type 1 isoform X3 [Drosophila albomicans]